MVRNHKEATKKPGDSGRPRPPGRPALSVRPGGSERDRQAHVGAWLAQLAGTSLAGRSAPVGRMSSCRVREGVAPFSRREAAHLVTDSGRTTAVVAQQIGVSMQLLGRSVVIEQAKAVDPQGILGEDERGELQRFHVNAPGSGWFGRSANESGGYCGVIAVSRRPLEFAQDLPVDLLSVAVTVGVVVVLVLQGVEWRWAGQETTGLTDG